MSRHSRVTNQQRSLQSIRVPYQMVHLLKKNFRFAQWPAFLRLSRGQTIDLRWLCVQTKLMPIYKGIIDLLSKMVKFHDITMKICSKLAKVEKNYGEFNFIHILYNNLNFYWDNNLCLYVFLRADNKNFQF